MTEPFSWRWRRMIVSLGGAQMRDLHVQVLLPGFPAQRVHRLRPSACVAAIGRRRKRKPSAKGGSGGRLGSCVLEREADLGEVNICG